MRTGRSGFGRERPLTSPPTGNKNAAYDLYALMALIETGDGASRFRLFFLFTRTGSRKKRMSGCKRLRQYLEMQLAAVREDEHFQRHKWYRSEEARCDIGFRAALNSFACLPDYERFARTFRQQYCQTCCDVRQECPVCRGSSTGNTDCIPIFSAA